MTTTRKPELTNSAVPADIAIIGIECALPKAKNKDAFWQNIFDGVYAISEIPAERWPSDLYFDADRGAKDKIYSRWGGFMEDVAFDPLEFGMPPNSLKAIDPMQLMALKIAKAALIDAGYGGSAENHEQTGIVLGMACGLGDVGNRYVMRSGLPMLVGAETAAEIVGQTDYLPEWTEDSFPGLLLNVTAGRIANRLNFGAANYIVDAACASSLAAVQSAVYELMSGSAEMMIAGGVDTLQNPFIYTCFSKTRALSPTGEPRVFDESSDGIVISEGIVMLVLKRLADAKRDGDRIYSVIKAISTSSDGRALSMTAPRLEGQQLALKRAYAKAGIDPTSVQLFEAHGTGTPLGDKTELLSLGQFLEQHGAEQHQHAIGSVKSMIGHTKASAGIAGLAKTALAQYHKVLPPTLGVTKPNTKAKLDQSPLYVNGDTRPWLKQNGQPRRAGVSAFGFGGTNFHVITEEYEAGAQPSTTTERSAELFVFSAEHPDQLASKLSQLQSFLGDGAPPTLADLAYTCWLAWRPQPSVKLGIVATDKTDLTEKIKAALKHLSDETYSSPDGAIIYRQQPLDGQIAVLFAGHGTQYPNMLRDLALHFPSVRETFEQADEWLTPYFDRPISQAIFPPPAFDDATRKAQHKHLQTIQYAQPAIGIANVATYHLLQSFGLTPDMLAGHSYGEYIALYAAGMYDLREIIEFSAETAPFIQAEMTNNPGRMVAVQASPAEVNPIISRVDGVWLANCNSPNQTIIAGSPAGVESALRECVKQGLNSKTLRVEASFHTPMVYEPCRKIAAAAKHLTLKNPILPVYANKSTLPHPNDFAAILDAMADHFAVPVRFTKQIEQMYADGARIFVEVGPRNVLTNFVKDILGSKEVLAVSVDSPKVDGVQQLTKTLGQLLVCGVGLTLDPLFANRSVSQVNFTALYNSVEKISKTTWRLNSGSAEPWHAPIKQPQPNKIAPPKQVSRPVASQKNGHKPMTQSSSHLPAVSQQTNSAQWNQVQQLFIQGHFELMNQFLNNQREMMLAMLGMEVSAPLIATPTSPIFSPAPTTIEPIVRPEATFEPVVVEVPIRPKSNGQHHQNGHTQSQPTPEKISSVATLAPIAESVDVENTLRQLIAQKTGYPEEAIDSDLDLDADLGIDSIKRVEILGGLRAVLDGKIDHLDVDDLAEKQTIYELARFVEAHL